jgi:acyl dehydratase
MSEGDGIPGVKVGEKFVSPGRTITEADIVMFAALTGDWTELHTNAEYVKKTIFGQRIAHGLLTLSVASGLALRARRMSTLEVMAFLGLDNVRFTAPVFIGDTIWVESEVVEARPSKSRPGAGIIRFRNVVRSQRNEVVATYETAIMVRVEAEGR